MISNLTTFARTGLVALGVMTAGMAYAGPAGFAGAPATPAPSALALTPVGWICDGSSGVPGGCRNNETGEVRSRNSIKGGGDRDRDYDRYERRRDRDYDDNRRFRRDRRYNDGPNIYFGLGVPDYRYVEPRRVYRGGGISAHVEWCRDRWRSYRPSDNTYKPAKGPRRQCVSPYS